jgi:predicted CoA-binding protein
VSPDRAIEDFLAQKDFALYGMSRGGNKFGSRVYVDLTSKGYRILPVHPVAKEIGGVRIGRVWMQPGAESKESVGYCEENGISVVFQECVMVRSSRRPG